MINKVNFSIYSLYKFSFISFILYGKCVSRLKIINYSNLTGVLKNQIHLILQNCECSSVYI